MSLAIVDYAKHFSFNMLHPLAVLCSNMLDIDVLEIERTTLSL